MSFRRGETDRIREPRTAGTPMVLGYLIETTSGEYIPTADQMAATHVFARGPETGDVVIAPLGTNTEGVRTLRIGGETYALTGV